MKTSATLVRRNGYAGIAAVGVTASIVVAVLVGIFSPATAPGLVVLVSVFGWPFAVGLAGAWAAYWRPWRSRVTIEAKGGVLRVDGVTVRAAGTLSRGDATVLAETRIRVELRAARLERVRLEVTKTATARALLAALGLDRRLGTSKFRVRRLREYAGLLVMAAFVALLVCLGVAFTVSGYLGLALLAFVVGGPIADHVRTRVELTVGADGIDLRSPFGRTFIAHARIRSIERIWPGAHGSDVTHEGESAYGFDIELDDESYHRIDTRPERARSEGANVDPAFDAAMEAWSAWKDCAAGAPAHATTLLARGERSTNEWLAGLRGLAVDGGSGYRVAALDAQALFAVLVDAEAPCELRAAAAVVLGAKEQHAPRLRVVADDVADPIVRRIAVASADPEDETTHLETELEQASRRDLA